MSNLRNYSQLLILLLFLKFYVNSSSTTEICITRVYICNSAGDSLPSEPDPYAKVYLTTGGQNTYLFKTGKGNDENKVLFDLGEECATVSGVSQTFRVDIYDYDDTNSDDFRCSVIFEVNGGDQTLEWGCTASGASCNDGVTAVFDINSPSPTPAPTRSPTVSPIIRPTSSPTISPTRAPTFSPVIRPTSSPTVLPTRAPTLSPTPTLPPTNAPTLSPIIPPTSSPTSAPTFPPVQSYNWIIKKDLSCSQLFNTLQYYKNITLEYCEYLCSKNILCDIFVYTTSYKLNDNDQRCYLFNSSNCISTIPTLNTTLYYKTYEFECIDSPLLWKDSSGESCSSYTNWCNNGTLLVDPSNFDLYRSDGYTAINACCQCGGGMNVYNDVGISIDSYTNDFTYNSIYKYRQWVFGDYLMLCSYYFNISCESINYNISGICNNSNYLFVFDKNTTQLIINNNWFLWYPRNQYLCNEHDNYINNNNSNFVVLYATAVFNTLAPTLSPTLSPVTHTNSSKLSAGIIVSIVIASIMLIAFVLFLYRYYQRKSSSLSSSLSPSPNPEPSAPIEVLCVICQDKPATHVIVPCGHKILCQDHTSTEPLNYKCPNCRASIQQVIRSY